MVLSSKIYEKISNLTLRPKTRLDLDENQVKIRLDMFSLILHKGKTLFIAFILFKFIHIGFSTLPPTYILKFEEIEAFRSFN